MAALMRAKKLPSLKDLLHPPETKVLAKAEIGRRKQEHAELVVRMTRNGE